MQYSVNRLADAAGEPSLTNMTEFAIKMLSKNKNGFFLLVEGESSRHFTILKNAFMRITSMGWMTGSQSLA